MCPLFRPFQKRLDCVKHANTFMPKLVLDGTIEICWLRLCQRRVILPVIRSCECGEYRRLGTHQNLICAEISLRHQNWNGAVDLDQWESKFDIVSILPRWVNGDLLIR
jgi:hypothetical protein